jgi:electron transfer flavoprotein alpha subunit
VTILVWPARSPWAAELIMRARELPTPLSREVAVLDLDGRASPGEDAADVLVRVEPSPAADDPDVCVECVSRAARHVAADLVLVGASKLGLEVGPRVAERLAAAYAPWALGFGIDAQTGTFTARCTTYAGSAETTYDFGPGPLVATMAGGSEGAKAPARAAVRIETLSVASAAPRLRVLAERPKVAGERLESARAIVDLGLGVRDRDDLGLMAELARALDARVACSRPIAAEREWLPEWLGLSGAKVAPELCLAIGVSGAIQHIVGIRGSRIIVAVNSDPDAAIFAEADLGVVADLYEFVPALIERLRTRGIRPGWDGA